MQNNWTINDNKGTGNAFDSNCCFHFDCQAFHNAIKFRVASQGNEEAPLGPIMHYFIRFLACVVQSI